MTENRILVTLDEHFGDRVILQLSRHPGVIQVRVNPTTTKNIIRVRAIIVSYFFFALSFLWMRFKKPSTLFNHINTAGET